MPFDLDGLGYKGLGADFRAESGIVAFDATGNVYVVPDRGTSDPEVVRITPGGEAAPYLRLRGLGYVSQLTVLWDGSMVVRGSRSGADGPSALYSVQRSGSLTPLVPSPALSHPVLVGEYPAGSLVVRDDSGLWSLRAGRATRRPGAGGAFRLGKKWNVVDPSGTVYAVDDTLGKTRAQPVGKPPYGLTVTGSVPGGAAALAKLHVTWVIPASSGGFYAVASPESYDPYYVVHVTPTGAGTTVLAQFGLHAAGCAVGKGYPALGNSCEPSWFLAESGRRLLMLGPLMRGTPGLVLAGVGP
ncbi:hypothetical protein [Streptomyces sp. NPDC021020]|uniref:hypothetical protein n=1 Tax=Streptomyces sp. NPDC021020 TaxID=3365109 RepID=UPI00379FBDF1